ncbi:SPFH domain-containing protein [Streptomyces tanashiensis]|uniref:SPFH domain-containing protein n=1 Tax=Streptomyces tanashiensis TaxID=67367 RepID=UPI001E478B46|nr:SPFH domain-containing protein [Streptomyces tanashiensis]
MSGPEPVKPAGPGAVSVSVTPGEAPPGTAPAAATPVSATPASVGLASGAVPVPPAGAVSGVTQGPAAGPASGAAPTGPASGTSTEAAAPAAAVSGARREGTGPRAAASAPGGDRPTGKTTDETVVKATDKATDKTDDETADKATTMATATVPADALDFGRIRGAGVGAVAMPVAAVVRVARRKNVIGTETTGSIPVHLLFRDEPETAVPVPVGDDGGPDTISMAAPTPPAVGRRPAIPGPSKVQAPAKPDPASKAGARPGARSEPRSKGRSKDRSKVTAPSPSHPQGAASRPAPTADPALVERPGPVLPGWMGVVAGVLAVSWCAAVVWWAGAVPAEAARMLRLPVRPYHGIHLGQWALLALGVVLALFSLGGLGRGRVGYAWVLTLFGDYRGTVRRTGLLWVSPLLLRRRVDVRLRHWRSEPLSAVDAKGTALDVTVLVVWRVRDTVRAALGVDGHEDYLREQVEAAMARVLSQLPADAFHEDAPTLRDAEAVGEALTRMLSAECAPVGVDVFSAQPTRIEYAPEVAAAMRRRRIAAIDAKHRDSVLTSVVDAVDDVVHRLTSRGLVELDDYERKALVKDLTVAFYTGRTGPVEGA